jgi:hypothetical protein
LEPKDIDIYINGVKEISDFIAERGKIQMEYVKFMTDVFMLISVFHTIVSEDHLSDEELSRNKGVFNNFLNIKIDDKYEKAFRKIGWNENGHQKYWVIYYSVYSIVMYNRIEDSYREQGVEKNMIVQHNRIFELINEDDFKIINDRIEDIVKSLRNN